MAVIARNFPLSGRRLTFKQCVERLRDGRAYVFATDGMRGYFYKAPFPEDVAQTCIDGACSAITHYDKQTHRPSMPTLMLYDFDDDENEWFIVSVRSHPSVSPPTCWEEK